MDKEYIIYCHTNKINNKKYIGQTCESENQRYKKDGKGYQECPRFWNAIQKYGWENFSHEILETGIKNAEEANIREAYWIEYYHTWIDDPLCWGYNLQKSGLNKEVSKETKEKMSNSKLGEKNSFYGKKHTEEAKEAIRQARLGSHASEETKKKMSEARKGKRIGEENPMYGKTGFLNASSKAVVCIETGEIFGSQGEAARAKGINQSTISKNIKDPNRKGKKYNWRWATEEDLTNYKIDI